MSYCSFSKESDVDVRFGGGGFEPDGYHITTAYDRRVNIPGRGLVQDFTVESPLKAATLLISLRRAGLKVPQAAINQLIEEARSK